MLGSGVLFCFFPNKSGIQSETYKLNIILDSFASSSEISGGGGGGGR